MRGDYKGFEGKVTEVDREKYRIFVEGVTREKVDGTTIPVPIHPSKVMITRLNLDDKWRAEALKRKSAGKKAELPKEELEKPPEKEAKPKPRVRERKRKKKESKSTVKSEEP
jgi:ribosomal protein L24